LRLAAALAGYDGKRVAFLESLLERFDPAPEVLTQAIDLVDDPDDRIAGGATWLLRAYLNGGAVLSESQHENLAARLADVRAPWARLHLCQAVRTLDLPGASEASAWAVFLSGAATSRRPFERAWAVDGLAHLGGRFERYRGTAREALECALTDPAPSVRARARRLAAGGSPAGL
jgi:hypothetical protein